MTQPGENVFNHSSWSLIATVGGEAVPGSVDAALAQHFERIGMADEVAEAYGSAHTPVYASGVDVVDGLLLSDLNLGKVKTAHALTTDYRFLIEPDEYFSANMPGTTRREREQVWAQAKWDDESSLDWVHKAENEQNGGLAATPELQAISTLAQLTYAPELGYANVIPPALLTRDRSGSRQLSSLFTRPELREGIPAHLLVGKLRQAGMMDASPVRLDERIENLHMVLQVSVGAETMRMISDMWSAAGGARSAATMLFHRYRGLLIQDNLPAKMLMLQDVQSTLVRLAARPRMQQNERRVLEAHSTRLTVFSGEVARLRGMFAHVYQVLGYDLPPLLADFAPETAQIDEPDEVVVAAGEVAVEAAITPEPDAEVVAALQAQGAQLVFDSTQANRAWMMTAKERKNTGLDGAVRTLMAGSLDAVGQPLLSAMDRHDAEAFVAVLRRLDAMGGKGGEAGRQALAAALDRRSEVASRTRTLREQVGRDAPGATVAYPVDSVPVERHMQAMRGDWRRYEQVLLAIWPAATVRQTITNIHSVLFTPEV